jgi:dihydroorotate dehydrogenase electron transfer subunit
MSTVISNGRLSGDYWLLKAAVKNNARMGQFYMVRAWDTFPVLSRPMSIFDADAESITILYKVVGLGTELFTELHPGCEVELLGPLGNGIPDEIAPKSGGKVALLGGGTGTAPSYLAAKQIKAANPACSIDLFLNFGNIPVLEEQYRAVGNARFGSLRKFVSGGEFNPAGYDGVFVCGPDVLMEHVYTVCKEAGTGSKVWVSLEKHMACGVGACLGCTVRVKTEDDEKNMRCCKDGPVFPAEILTDL